MPATASSAIRNGVRPAPRAAVTIAVMPFVTGGDDPSQAYLSDGIAEDVATELQRFRDILVTGWESSLACRRFLEDAARVARQLQVQYVLQGRVERIDAKLCVAVRLIDGREASQVAEDRFEGTLADALSLPEEIARRIAGRLTSDRRAAGASRAKTPPRNFQAHDMLLRARAALRRGGSADDPELIADGITLAREAAAQDPRYAEAYRYLAWGHCLRAELRSFGPEGQADYDEAAEAALRQRELDPLNHAAHALSGHIAMRQMRHGEAMASLRLAHEINPNDVTTLRWLSWEEANHELPDAAREHSALSLRLSPCDKLVEQGHWPLALADYVASDPAACVLHARRAVAMRPRFAVHYIVLAACLAELGELIEAHYTLVAAQTLNPKLVESRLSGKCYFVRSDLTSRYVRALRLAAAGREALRSKSGHSPAAARGGAAKRSSTSPPLFPPALVTLTRREREVLGLVAHGDSNAEIAAALGISEHTAKRHIANILTKLDLPTRGAAASLAARYALV